MKEQAIAVSGRDETWAKAPKGQSPNREIAIKARLEQLAGEAAALGLNLSAHLIGVAAMAVEEELQEMAGHSLAQGG